MRSYLCSYPFIKQLIFYPASPSCSRVYLTGLSAIMSSFFLSFLFRSCSVFFSLSGTSLSLDCMSLITSCRSDSEGNVRWHTGQQGCLSSVSWLMNWVYTAVAPASMAEEKHPGRNRRMRWKDTRSFTHPSLHLQDFTIRVDHLFLSIHLSVWRPSPDPLAACSGPAPGPDCRTHWRTSPRRCWAAAPSCVIQQQRGSYSAHLMPGLCCQL